MKKSIKSIVVIAMILISGSVFSQSPLQIGEAQINVGAGLSGWGVPFYVGLDFGIHEDVTIGGEFSYRSYRENWKYNYYRHNVTGISANANYHFNSLLDIPRDWDFYGGLNLGFYSWSSPDNYYGSHSSGLGIGAQIGGRYYFSEKAGINLEIGGGNAFSNGKVGISIKL